MDEEMKETPKTKELLFSITKKDLEIQTFRSGGPGGQAQNKLETGVRIIHKASGAVGESRTERSQHANKKLALKRLTETDKFKNWIKIKASEISTGKTIAETVEEMMLPEHIKVEVKDENDKWKLITL